MTDQPEGRDASLIGARLAVGQATRRLGAIETVLMVAAALVALLAGAITAWGVAEATGWAFRPVWIAASVIFFGVPGVVVLVRSRRDEAELRARLERALSTDDSTDDRS